MLWGDAGDAQRELLRAVPVLVDADGVVVAGAQPLPPQLLPRLDGALDDVVPREGGRTRNRGDLLGRWEYFELLTIMITTRFFDSIAQFQLIPTDSNRL